MKIVSRTDALNRVSDDVKALLLKETHHDHPIVEINGSLHWQETPGVNQLLDTGLELNRLIDMLQHLGIDKNHEVYRDLFRKMGYSLDGYWEIFVFYNQDCDQYQPPGPVLFALVG
ncbi:MAG TPA: hypothetical protein DEH24_12130 [Alteromonas sp.]|nr:hypothetical protein [Alteromonas sp.]|tara:strand:+ start:1720 stop:2067 length:348 start_codon:yes stop_codon:yes gene_type:complete